MFRLSKEDKFGVFSKFVKSEKIAQQRNKAGHFSMCEVKETSDVSRYVTSSRQDPKFVVYARRGEEVSTIYCMNETTVNKVVESLGPCYDIVWSEKYE